MKTAYIGLGSNLGDRAENLRLARERMVSADLRILRASSIYETEPREFTDQPWFLNQVVEAETSLMPRQLLSRLLQIEREMGRVRTVKKGPRVIDLDILLYAGVVVKAGDLQIPHPAISERRFVLEPLAELASDLRIPHMQRAAGEVPTVRELLGNLHGQIVRRFDDGASR